MKHRYYIGIDPGKNTGVAVWSSEEKILKMIKTVMIHQAMKEVLAWAEVGSVFVVFEDARKRTFLKHKEAGAIQGAGSIKRDCTIWEDFLTDEKIPFDMRKPAGTKKSAGYLQLITGWTARTSNHARDAAFLVIGS